MYFKLVEDLTLLHALLVEPVQQSTAASSRHARAAEPWAIAQPTQVDAFEFLDETYFEDPHTKVNADSEAAATAVVAAVATELGKLPLLINMVVEAHCWFLFLMSYFRICIAKL